MDSNDNDLIVLVHDTVSSSNEFVAYIDDLLKAPLDTYPIPREYLFKARMILSTNASLTKSLFEMNQSSVEFVEDFLKDNP
jgi:hypothetical protein